MDADARRLMRRRWPGLIEWGDVRPISKEHVLKAPSVYGQSCDMVILGAGSPCQDLSSLKRSKGLDGEKSSFLQSPSVVLSPLVKAV